MARGGRKRKLGERYPSGQLKQKPKAEREADDRTRTSRQPHRRAVARAMRAGGATAADAAVAMGSEAAESPLGRLLLADLLLTPGSDDKQAARDRYDAGCMYAQVVGAYRSVIEAPRAVAGSGRGFPCEPKLCERDPARCECRRRLERYQAAYAAVCGPWRQQICFAVSDDYPEPLRAAIAEAARLRADETFVAVANVRRRIVMAVNRVCVHREEIEPSELVYLIAGLDILVDHFGLTAKRRRSHYRNAN